MKILFIFLLFTQPAYSSLCDKDFKTYLEAEKARIKTKRVDGEEFLKAYHKLKENNDKWHNIYNEKKCKEKVELINRVADRKAFKAWMAWVDYCFEKKEKILYKLHPNLKKTRKKRKKAYEKATEAKENFYDCVEAAQTIKEQRK